MDLTDGLFETIFCTVLTSVECIILLDINILVIFYNAIAQRRTKSYSLVNTVY
ncbi:MAG: hypothetical protein V7K38_27095 [Nostoc sp.]